MDVSVAGSTLVLDFDVEVERQSGQSAGINLVAKQATDTGLTIGMAGVHFTITNLDLLMRKSNSKYLWTLSGDTSIRGKPVTFSYVHDPNQAGGRPFMNVLTKMTLAELVGSQNLPGLDDVELDGIQVWPDDLTVYATLKGVKTVISVQKAASVSGHYVGASFFDSFSPATMIPGAADTPLKDVDFKNLVVLYSPESNPVSLDSANLTGDITGRIRQSQPNPTIKPGLNMFGLLEVHPEGEMKTLLSKVGITDVTFPLNGKIGRSLFHGNPTAAIKNEIMDNLDLHLPLPTPNIPGLDKALTFNNGKMHIKGTLPDGSQGISIEVSGDADVHFGASDNVDFAVDVTYDRSTGGTEKELKVTGSTTTPWNNPFGMTWIDLTNLSVTFDERINDGVTDWDVSVDAKSTIGHHSNLDVTVNVTEENGVMTGASFTLVGPLDLSEVPGIGDIPEVKYLTIKSLTASKQGIDARTTFQSKETDFFAFENNDKWVIALSQNNFTLTEIVPPLAATPLKDIVLSEAAIVFAQTQVNGALSSFGPVAQAAFKDIYQITASNALDPQISIAEGLNLIAAFEHSKSTGAMKGGMSKLGMSEERVIIMGDIGGIMGDANPHVNLDVELSQHGRPHNMPKWMNFADNTAIIFSIYGSVAGDDPVVEIGIGVDISTRIHDDNLTFDAKVGLEFQEEAATLKFVMDLKNGNLSDGGTTDSGLNCSLTNTPGHKNQPGPAGWHRPFGIPGLALYDVAMDLGIDEDGAIHLGFAGGAKIGGDRFCVAADADLSPEEEGAPQDIAFVGAADFVEMYFMQDLALQVAADPDLHIQGEGVALKGELYWLGKTLGSVDMAIGPTTGIKFDGTIGEPRPDGTAGDLTIGPIAFKDTYLDFQIPMPPKNPLDGYFKLNANVTIPVVNITEKINADVTNKGMSFSVTNTILSDFSETLTLALTGVDLSVTHPDVSDADFAISGSLQADFATFIRNTLPNIVNSLFAELNQTLLDGEKAITAAENKVNDLNAKINHERAAVRYEKAKIEDRLHTAQARVDAIQKNIDHDWKKYHHCSHWQFWCKPRWGITIGFEKGVKDAADLILEAVERLVSHVPIDFDPRVWPLIAAKDSAKLTLKLAEEGIVGLDDLASYATKGLNEIDVFPGGAVNLKHASFNGDLKEIITSDAPVDLNVDIELFGADFSETFAFRLGDAKNELTNLGKAGAKDSAHLSLLGYVAVDHLFNKVLSDIPNPFKMQLGRSLGSRIHNTQTALQTELAAYKADFQKYHKTAQTLHAQYSTFADSYSAALMQKRVTPLDKEPASKTFTDMRIELGLTGICLHSTHDMYHTYNGCAGKGISQHFWTENVLYTSGKKKGQPTGYVKINSKGTYGNIRSLTIPGKWKFEEVTYDNNIVEQEVFKPYTFWGYAYGHGDPQPYGIPYYLTKNECNGPQCQWKVLAHGDGYFQLHNRATQTCIWMNWANELMGDMTKWLEMIPCTGANSGVFRNAKAIPAVYHRVGLPLKQGYVYNKDGQDPQDLKCVGINRERSKRDSRTSINWVSCDIRESS